MVPRFELRIYMLVRQSLYHSIHTPRHFCFSYFLETVSCFQLGQTGLKSFQFCHLDSWDDRDAPPCLVYLLRWGLANFLPELALNSHLSYLHLSSSGDYRHGPLQADFDFIYSLFLTALA
jgi:hypothetical protein